MNLEETVLPVATQMPNPLHPESEDPTEKYRILHQYVLDYQAGKPGAAEAILDSFREFLFKYYNFIVHGGCYLKNTSIRRFISLFSDLKQSSVPTYRYSIYIQDRLVKCGDAVRRRLSAYEPEDVLQYLNLALLEMATRYRDYSRPSFHTYVHKNFHFYAARAFPLKDPIYYSTLSSDVELLCDTEFLKENMEDYQRLEKQIDHELLIEKTQEFIVNEEGVSVYDDEVLNLNWINGVTCSGAFKTLTPFERKIIILSYHHKMQDDDIANEFGFCRATINRKKISAVKKLLNVIQDN